ncbi:MAG: radical SAM protein [Desulfovibrio sp. S3730MH75]|nr:MAG: radical SAM protein [Desulfovibrio sp. S3730MH75]
MSEKDALVARYKFGATYIADFAEFRELVLGKTVVPHQVEIQPGPAGSNICWLQCPYCYGGSADDTGERLSGERSVEILEEIAAGGVNKVIFAGYCTDPLNSTYIEDLLSVAIKRGLIFGFNTKSLRVSERFLDLLSSSEIASGSYFSVSVDAGFNSSYNTVHAIANESARIYDRVLKNVANISSVRKASGVYLDISVAYLINRLNNTNGEIRKFVADFSEAGCNLMRFTFPQLPRGKVEGELPTAVPSAEECARYRYRLEPLIAELDSDSCRVLFVDADHEHDILRKARTTPCVARFVYPTVGFDGWLYHCSQSSAPNFRKMALGNLAERSFWDLFYDYDADHLERYFAECERIMEEVNCRCDRKEHLVNAGVVKSGVFGCISQGAGQ